MSFSLILDSTQVATRKIRNRWNDSNLVDCFQTSLSSQIRYRLISYYSLQRIDRRFHKLKVKSHPGRQSPALCLRWFSSLVLARSTPGSLSEIPIAQYPTIKSTIFSKIFQLHKSIHRIIVLEFIQNRPRRFFSRRFSSSFFSLPFSLSAHTGCTVKSTGSCFHGARDRYL